MTKSLADNPETTLRIMRTLAAPPDRVFDAWLDPRRLAMWIGPRNFEVRAESVQVEPKVGGEFRIQMLKSDGTRMVVTGTYTQIARPSQLAFTWTWDHDRHETLVTVSLRSVGAGTELTLIHQNFTDSARRDGHNQGWSVCLEQLESYLQKNEQ